MPIRELSRLNQMNIENLTAERARVELANVRDRLAVEDAALGERLEAGARAEQQLKTAQAALVRAEAEKSALSGQMQKTVGALQDRTAALEAERTSLLNQVRAQESLIRDLQDKAAQTRPAPPAEARVRDFMSRLSADIAEAGQDERLAAGFVLSEVAIDVHAPVGVKDGQPVMLFSEAAQSAPEGVSRIQMRLERSVKIKKVEEDG